MASGCGTGLTKTRQDFGPKQIRLKGALKKGMLILKCSSSQDVEIELTSNPYETESGWCVNFITEGGKEEHLYLETYNILSDGGCWSLHYWLETVE